MIARAAMVLVLAAVVAVWQYQAPSGGRTYIGTPGADRLHATSRGGDTLWGGGGADTLIGGPGPDEIYGVRSNNTIVGKGGDDYLEGGTGSDDIDAGSGDNTVLGDSGQDIIDAGDGDNYVDAGGGNDRVRLGDGNNVLLTGSGGGTFTVGSGTNTVYYGSGIAYISAGKGDNTLYLSGTAGVRKLDCGGNPATTVYVNEAGLGRYSLQILARKARRCTNILTYDGRPRVVAVVAGRWESFHLKGGAGRDKLFGGHGGGTINGGEGDNEIWADMNEDTGLPRSRRYTTRVVAGDGDNRIFGGRGTNVVAAGDGDNFVRGGTFVNRVHVGSGDNVIRLQGSDSTNTVTIDGRGDGVGSYVESLANGKRPVIRCINGAKAVIVYGNTKPRSNCRPSVSARSQSGGRYQLKLTPQITGSAPIVDLQLQPGENGVGVVHP